MKVVKLVDRDLKEVEKGTIQKFQYYFESKAPFALIGDHVIVLLPKDSDKKIEEFKESVEKITDEMMSITPDFAEYGMDDGYGIAVMGEWNVVGVSSQKLSDEENENEEVSFETAFAMREEIMECCDNLEIIALVLND